MAKKRPYNSIPRNGLVGEYLLNGNALDTNDGTKNNGTATNVTWVDTDKGYQKQCGSFDGSSSKISISDNINYRGDIFTYSVWCKFTYSQSEERYIIGKYQSGGDKAILIGTNISVTGDIGFQIRTGAGVNATAVTTTTYNDGKYHHLVGIKNGTTVSLYIDGKFISSSNNPSLGTVDNTDILYIGAINSSTGNVFNGQIQGVRIYNRVLSQSEIQNLYQEGLRQLGAGSDGILSSAVGIFENYGDTDLYDIKNGIVATRTGGTSTTDNFGISKAITNPNYSWSSITYTAGYTFEDDGTGWAIKTNPTGLSATGINRTTTLRNIYLMNKTLSSDEVKELYNLSSKKYLYPFKKTLPLNLRNGLRLWMPGDNNSGVYYDASGNGNNLTRTGTLSDSRKFQHKYINCDGTTKYLTGPTLGSGITEATFAVSGLIPSYSALYTGVIACYNDNSPSPSQSVGEIDFATSSGLVYIEGFSMSGSTFNVVRFDKGEYNKRYRAVLVIKNGSTQLYINGTLIGTNTNTGINFANFASMPITIGTDYGNSTRQFPHKIANGMVRARALTPIEIQQDFYSTFIN